jgi:hypothetical protein
MAIPSGSKLGSYEVVAQIGAGGMGDVSIKQARSEAR